MMTVPDDEEDSREWSGEDAFLKAVAEAPEHAPFLPTLSKGEIIAGRFRLERPLGEGGMGVVWAAQHLVTRKPVALKFLKSTTRRHHAETRRRFLREARAACAVRHPNVVEVHDVIELADDSPVMVMDLLEGESFASRLAREGALPLPEVARIMLPVCAAAGCAHAIGIVHRDLKPDNIFLAVQEDGTKIVKVLDFGIAKLTATEGDAAHSGATTGTGMLLGTPYYMAPEQMFGEKDVDHRADLWAIGIILYEALAGERPTQGENVGQILKRVTRDGLVPLRERAPHLPAPVLDLVSRLLEQDRRRRPDDLREAVSVLSGYTDAVVEPFGAPRRSDASALGSDSDPPASAKVRVDSAEADALTLGEGQRAASSESEAPAKPVPPLAKRLEASPEEPAAHRKIPWLAAGGTAIGAVVLTLVALRPGSAGTANQVAARPSSAVVSATPVATSPPPSALVTSAATLDSAPARSDSVAPIAASSLRPPGSARRVATVPPARSAAPPMAASARADTGAAAAPTATTPKMADDL
jgi:serine/threonine-protein kinase